MYGSAKLEKLNMNVIIFSVDTCKTDLDVWSELLSS